MSATLSAVLPPSLVLKEKWALPFCGVGGSSGRNSTMCGLFAWRRRQPRLMTCIMPDSTSLVLQLRGPDPPPLRPAPPDASCFWHESRTCRFGATKSGSRLILTQQRKKRYHTRSNLITVSSSRRLDYFTSGFARQRKNRGGSFACI